MVMYVFVTGFNRRKTPDFYVMFFSLYIAKVPSTNYTTLKNFVVSFELRLAMTTK